MRPLHRLAVPLVALAALLAGCVKPVTKEEMASVDYGPRPAGNEQLIRDYLKVRLTDPTSAIIEFRAGPQIFYQRDATVRGQQHGWATCVWVNDKNRSGAFDGFYPMVVFVRNDKIVHVNGGPDDNGVIGARFARNQCKELGAPFVQ